jgi:hypothetical protein
VTFTEVADIQDKGEDAIVMLRGRGSDPESGTLVAETLSTALIRGEGGFGGQPGPTPGSRARRPGRPADSRGPSADGGPDEAIKVSTAGEDQPAYRGTMPAVGALVRCTDGSWMTRPPQNCPRGH